MTHLRNAVLNAINNALRKKGKRFIDLFNKKNVKVDVEFNENAIEIIQEIEETEGKGWVDLLYERANLRRPTQKEGE